MWIQKRGLEHVLVKDELYCWETYEVWVFGKQYQKKSSKVKEPKWVLEMGSRPGSWKASTAVRSTCSRRRPRFSSQHAHGGSELGINLIPRDPAFSSVLAHSLLTTHMCDTISADKIVRHIQEKKRRRHWPASTGFCSFCSPESCRVLVFLAVT